MLLLKQTRKHGKGICYTLRKIVLRKKLIQFKNVLNYTHCVDLYFIDDYPGGSSSEARPNIQFPLSGVIGISSTEVVERIVMRYFNIM